MFDFHTHTNNSHDGNQSVDELCQYTIKAGLSGVAVTDHAETWYYEEHQPVKCISNCIVQVNEAKKKYPIKVFQGIEIGSPLDDIEITKELMSLGEYDVILNSIHCISYGYINDSFAAIDFSNMDEDYIYKLLDVYFEKIFEMAQKSDFDVLCHLTYPLRYINGKYKRNIDILKYNDIIDDILKVVKEREKSLEINTAYASRGYGFCPDESYLKRYFELGGRLVTLGSDSHDGSGIVKIGDSFDECIQMLRQIGFDKITYFEKRQKFYVNI